MGQHLVEDSEVGAFDGFFLTHALRHALLCRLRPVVKPQQPTAQGSHRLELDLLIRFSPVEGMVSRQLEYGSLRAMVGNLCFVGREGGLGATSYLCFTVLRVSSRLLLR